MISDMKDDVSFFISQISDIHMKCNWFVLTKSLKLEAFCQIDRTCIPAILTLTGTGPGLTFTSPARISKIARRKETECLVGGIRRRLDIQPLQAIRQSEFGAGKSQLALLQVH